MKNILHILVVALFATSAWAQPEKSGVQLSSISMNGKTIVHKIDGARAKALVEWKPDSEDPVPLPVNKAVKIGKEWLSKKFPSMEQCPIIKIDLQKIRWSLVDNRWYYTIQYTPTVGGKIQHGPECNAVVLMDGTVVEPTSGDAK